MSITLKLLLSVGCLLMLTVAFVNDTFSPVPRTCLSLSLRFCPRLAFLHLTGLHIDAFTKLDCPSDDSCFFEIRLIYFRFFSV